ncbi:interferon alpha/beta receptor 1a-like isoform X1 [Conger conger]|uniref:interferon alpha/beta receptor 1a-like isoform X1 n=1 Tax=Conger conger TaxID=82655 RepID=UPI002A5A712B|nr:interferon alpha/beta receptor 1a-like isoform X1 [Conger conger]XP_061089853.1 interferon alpha/beta receptor 1a-like isoform X1 [Conger conger]
MWVLTWRLAFIFITVTTALHSPYNVRMEPVNSRHILLWDWDQTQANCTTTFTSDYNYSNKEKTEDYKRVCYRTAGRSCDFSRQNLSYSGSFVLRVRAEAEGEISAWSSRKFSPDQQALEPPSHVEVQSGEAMLTVIITEHLTVYNLPMSALEPLSYRVQYWEKHNPQRNRTQELEVTQGTLTALKPQTEYCLSVCIFHREEETSSPYTSTQCVKTGGRGRQFPSFFLPTGTFLLFCIMAMLQFSSHVLCLFQPDPLLGWYILLMIVILCCVMLATWFIFHRREKIMSLFLPPTLPSSLQDPLPSAVCHLLEPREESCTALVQPAVQTPGGLELWRAEQAATPPQYRSNQDSGFSSGGESSGSFQRLCE